MRRIIFFLPLFLLFIIPKSAYAQSTWTQHWLANVSKTQSTQPHWITPLVLVTPRLEQEYRADFVRQLLPHGQESWNYGNGKGLELIPQSHIELLFNVPPCLQHSQHGVRDGFGDVNLSMKYRIMSGNEKNGNYILTAFFGGTIPTGTYKNGSLSATLLPTVAGGKGWGRFDIESTLGGVLPVDSVQKVGRTVVWNTVAQQHVGRFFWPELEANASFFEGGPRDGQRQLFLTPGLVVGRFPIHHRIGLTLGGGMQIAATRDHTYNHSLVFTARVPF